MQKNYEHLKERECFWPDNSIYFLTDSTFLHFPYFNSEAKKKIVLDQIVKIKTQLNIPIQSYSIAVNHYHIKFYLKNGNDLKKVKQLLRGGISYLYRKNFKMPYGDMWQSRKIIWVKSELMDWKVSGYIAGNLLKHKEIGTFKELRKSRFSSFWNLVEKYGENEAIDIVRGVINVNEDARGEVDIDKLIDVL
jgi:hypothetical protein